MNEIGKMPDGERVKETGQKPIEQRDFNPDGRMDVSGDKLDKLSDRDIENYDPDKRIETTHYYTTEEQRMAHVPREDSAFGRWEGTRGNSVFIPSEETEAGREAKAKLAEKGLEGVEFKNGEPDFSKCAEATVEIDYMTENRPDYNDSAGERKEGNFTQADKKLAKQWTEAGRLKSDGTSEWTEKDIANWRSENKCSWHECCDTKTMHLVPWCIHDNLKHTGGCMECRIRDNKINGGIFDE